MKNLALISLVCCSLVLPACGNGTTVVAGAASITVTGITGTPFITVTPTMFTVTGTQFAQASGTTATVRFTAEGGVLAFNGGTSNTLDVPVTILDDGTVEGTTPSFLFPGIFNAFVSVILPGGAEGTSETAIAQFIGIQVDSVTPNMVPSDSQAPLSIGGTGFSPPAGNVTVRFIAETGTPFLNGTVDTIGPVPGTVNSLTEILANAAIAGVNVNAAAFVEVTFVDLPGMPVIQSAAPLVTFIPPTVDSVDLANIPSEIPTLLTITGTGYGPVGVANVNVRLQASLGTPFDNGTAAFKDVLGSVVNATTITITTPIFQVVPPTQPTLVQVTLPSGAGGISAGPLFSVDRPTVDSVDLANVPSEIPTLLTITGTGFAPNASAPTVRFRAPAGTPFLGGTAAFLDVTGTVVNDTTITCTTPRAGLNLDQAANIGVFLTTGITEILSPAPLVTFDRPTIASVAPTMVESEIPETVTITGTGFGSATGMCIVSITAPAIPFALGTLGSLVVTGTVVNPTTITFTSPIAGVQADTLSNVTLLFPTNATTALGSNLLTFKTPTVTASSLGTVDSENPTLITITGTGFAGGTPTVIFRNGSGPYAGGTLSEIAATGVTLVNATTITCTTPRAGVNVNAGSQIRVELTGGLQPISAGPLVTFLRAQTTSCAPTLIDPETATLVTVTGSGYYAPGTVTMRFIAAVGTPFSGSATLDVTGATVVNPTTVTATTPVLAALANKAVCSVAIVFASGASPTSGPGCTTFEAPPVAVDDNYGADGNVLLTVSTANGVIQGVGTDSDPDGDAITVSAFDAASVQGATVAVAADGSFTYDPPVGYEGPDSFTYTITDGFLFDTATVNLTVSGMVWFIDNTAAAGIGTFTSPFNTLAAFIAAGGANPPAAGDTIFLYSSATDYTGNLLLLANQVLLGQGVDLVHPGGNSPNPLVASSTRPSMDSTTGTTLTLATNNTIRGLDVDSTAGTAILGAAAGTVNVDTVEVNAVGGPALDISGATTLNCVFGELRSESAPSDGIDIVGAAGSLQVTGVTGVTNAGNDGINIENTAAGASFTFNSIDISNPLRDGICLLNHDGSFTVTGTTTLDDSAGANTMDNGIDINDCNPATTFTFGTVDIDRPTLDGICLTDVNGAGVTFGTTTIDDCGTSGIDIDSSAGTFTFSSIDIDTTTSDGINLTNVTGGFQVTGNGTIDSAGAEAIEVATGTADIDFGSLNIGSATSHGLRHTGAGTVGVAGATVINGAVDGIQCEGTVDMDFANITISGHTGVGIRVENGAFASSGTTSTTGGTNGVLLIFAAAGTDVDFNNLTITTPLDDGIFLNVAGGTFDVTGRCNIVTPGNEGSTPSLDHGIDIDGGSVAVTFADLDVSDSTGHCVEITGTSGAISITGDLGAGDSGGADLNNADDVGIYCENCTGTLNFQSLSIDESGDGAVDDFDQESHGIRIEDCTGNVTINNCTIDDCADHPGGVNFPPTDGTGNDNNCIHVWMDGGGTLPSLQITNCTLGGTEVATLGSTTDHGIKIVLDANSKITDVDVTGCACNDVGRAFCEVLCDIDNDGENCSIADLNISSNGTTTAIESQAEAIHVRVDGTSTTVCTINNNVIGDGVGVGGLSHGAGIRVAAGNFPVGVPGGTSTLRATISGNVIDDLGDFTNDNGIDVIVQEGATAIVLVDNNDIDGGSDVGIRVRTFDSSNADVTITDNDIGLTTLNTGEGILCETTFALAGHVLCLDINGNDCAAGDDYVINEISGTIELLNIGAGTHTAAQVDTFLEGQNTGNAASLGAGSIYTQCTSISTP